MANALSGGAYYLFLLCLSDLVFSQIRYSIPEELEIGAFVGNVAEDLRISVRELSARKFQLLAEDGKQYFEVNVENGILFVNERIDREQLCLESTTCSIFLELAVENPFKIFPLEVEILDINDNSPIFPNSSLSVQVAESVAPGARFPLESAHDPDVGSNTITAYQISSNEHFGLKMETRTDGSKIALLVLEKSLDREQQSAFELVLTALDGGIPHRTGAAQIIITVADVNDNAPVFDHEIYRASVLENTAKGNLLIKLHAADLDEGANAEFKYSFSNYASQNVRQLFKIDAETGEVRIQGLLDYEKSDVYELAVQAVDSGARVGHGKVLVSVIDVNDNAPEIKLTSLTKMVFEDAAPGSLIAEFSVTDRDSGDNGHVQCKIPNNMPFKLQTTLRKHYNLITTGILDREMTAMYNISITAWDAGSPSLSTYKNILVYVSDINDNVPRFTQSSFNVYLMENNTPGASIFSVTALDSDLDQNGGISYSILENQKQEVSASVYFTINSKSGSIFALRSFDYEQMKNFQIKVRAQDAGVPPLSSTAIVSIVILDQNDNAPLVISPLTWNSSATLEIAPQTIYPGYMVTKVMASDADSGQNARLSYELIEATDRSLFTVGLYTGEIRTTRSFIDQDSTTQTLVVLVRDNGQPSLSSTIKIVFLTSAKVTENPSQHVDDPRHAESFSDLNMYLIIIFASTSFIFLVTIILLVVLKCKQDRNNLGYQNPPSYFCCMPRNSNDVFNLRPTVNPSSNYYGTAQTLPVSEAYHYTVRLSPESSKSDFLFLKACHPTLALNDINDGNTSVRK